MEFDTACLPVIPAQPGTQSVESRNWLDTRLRGYDDLGIQEKVKP